MPQPGMGEGREGAGRGMWEVQGFKVHREGVSRLLLWEEERERTSWQKALLSLHGTPTHPQDALGTVKSIQIWDQKPCVSTLLVP